MESPIAHAADINPQKLDKRYGVRIMNKRQAQLQKLLEELLPDHLEELLQDTLNVVDDAMSSALDSARGSAKGATRNLNAERAKLEALGRAALESTDRAKIEAWAREALRSLDPDKLEAWARKSLHNVDSDKLKALLRAKLGNLDRAQLASLLKEGVRHLDRRRLEDRVRSRVHSLDLDKIKQNARARLTELEPHKVEEFVNARIDQVVRARLDALDTAQLETLLASKRAAQAQAQKATQGVAEAKHEGGNPLGALVGTLGRFAFLGAAGWIAYSHLFLEHQVPLPKAIAAELLTLVYRPSGPINIYQDRSGNGTDGKRPLVLIHSINAAASSYEMRPLFQHYRGKRPLFALDLPGFGFSARPNIEYTPEVYVNSILTMLEGISMGPADVVALSLGGEFAAEAARRRPELFHSLTLISPSGLSQMGAQGQDATGLGLDGLAYPLLSFRLWSRPFFDLLTTRRGINWYLQRSFVGTIPDGMVAYSVATSHQPGAEHAPLYFVAGKLFTPNAFERIYRHVTVPTLVIYDNDPYVRFDRLPELTATNRACALHPRWGCRSGKSPKPPSMRSMLSGRVSKRRNQHNPY
jgi:pimeloyl-ACP methyl ester carboxylesterase